MEFRKDLSIPGARAFAYIDGITVIFSPKNTQDTTDGAKITSWPQESLVLKGSELNSIKSQTLLVRVITLDDLSEI